MQTKIVEFLSKHGLGTLRNLKTVTGGDINEAFRVETDEASLFLKINSASQFPGMFEREQHGLKLLADSNFVVPKPIIVGQLGRFQFLALAWIQEGKPTETFWSDFGKNLAQMHCISHNKFGLDCDNYIGSLHQSNTEHKTWSDFYREERLIPQIKIASRNELLSPKMKRGFEHVFKRLEEIYPREKPALLHGDLWSGNMMVSSSGEPCIYDPAVYFGHREMDLAMMALFGGFGNSWVDTYNEVYPLAQGWRDRIEIGQLYPLMVHVNLFGASYQRSIEEILKKFV